MPYRVDLRDPPEDAFDRLVELGAIDAALTGDGIAAIMPDGITAAHVAWTLELEPDDVCVTPARGRDDGSVWVLNASPLRAGRLQVVPADWPPSADTLRMVDGPAFGTGLHPTTALCLEALDDTVTTEHPSSVLDVGTGSGILALAALHLGVAGAVAIDIDADAVRVAADNAILNGLSSRLHLVRGGPEALSGLWPLVLANVLAAPLVDMAPSLAKCVGRGGRLVLSGIRSSLAPEVEHAYRHVGMHHIRTQTRDGWTALTLQTSW